MDAAEQRAGGERQWYLRRLLGHVALAALVLAAGLTWTKDADKETDRETLENTVETATGVIVRVREGAALTEADLELLDLDLDIVDDLGRGTYLLDGGAGLNRADYLAIAGDLHDTHLFEFAAANAEIETFSTRSETLDDPDAETATGASNTQTGAGWNLDIMDGVLDGSHAIGPTGKGVYVYVIDSGVNPDHGDFTGRVVEIPGSDLVDSDDLPRACTWEQHTGSSHGHHVASSAAGFRYGLAKEATIVPIRALGCSGGAPKARLIAALNLVLTDNTARGFPPAVVNFSIGGACGGDCAAENPDFTATVQDLVDAGITVVIAAGNSAADACDFAPAFVPAALTVGNSTVSGSRSSSSNYGTCIDLYAPGTSIPAADHRDRVAATTKTGTSMAAPLVAGAAALYLSSVSDMAPAERPAAVESFLNAQAASFVSDKTPDADKVLRLPATWAANSSVVTGTGKVRLIFSEDVTGFAAEDVTVTGSATGCGVDLTATSASVYETEIVCSGSGSATAVLAANSVARADTSELGPDGPITSAAAQSDGKIVLGGFFTNYNGVPAQYIVRLNADGSIDEAFDTGTGPDAGVQSLALQPDGKIIVGGDFANFDGVAAARMVRLNSDGSLDTTFDVGTGPQSAPTALLVLGSGDVLVGGMFSSFDGFAQDAIVLIDSTGTVDATYTVAPDTYGHVFVLELLAGGKVLVAGNFSGFGGVPTEDIARLNADLTVDGTFVRGDDEHNHSIRDLVVQGDGKILVSGTGLYPLDETEVDWEYRAFVERLSANGSVDATFAKALGNFMGGARTALALLDDGSVLLGGNFSAINDSSVDPLVVLTSSGTLDRALPVDSSVRHLFRHAGGIVVVGSFTTYAGFDRRGILELDDDELDLGFQRTTAPAADLELPTLTFDTAAPTIPSGPVAVSGSTGEVTFELAYSEGVRSLSAGDLAVSGTATGCSVTSTIGAGNHYNAKVTCTGNGTVVLSLLANSSKDLAGNTGPGTTVSSAPYSMSGITATTSTTLATGGGGSSSPSTTAPAASGGTTAAPTTSVPATVPSVVQPPVTTAPAVPPSSTIPLTPVVAVRTIGVRENGRLAGSIVGVGSGRITGTMAAADGRPVRIEVRNRKGRLVRALTVTTTDGGEFTLFVPNGRYTLRVKATDGPNKGRTLWAMAGLRVG